MRLETSLTDTRDVNFLHFRVGSGELLVGSRVFGRGESWDSANTALDRGESFWIRVLAVQTKWVNLVGDGEGGEALFRELYAELKGMARGKMAFERPGITLNATALVHEAWMRLEKSAPEQWRDRPHFFASAAEAMRRILVEAARRRLAMKRGSGVVAVPLDGLEVAEEAESKRVIEVHQVIDQLEAEDPVKASIVKLRFFCEMENEEIAAILGVSEKTVRRHWTAAKVWLYEAILRDE